MQLCAEHIKSRIIHFRRDDDEDVAERARQLLSAVDGVSKASVRDRHSLKIRYDVRNLSLQMIESALADVGFILSDNPLCRIKRELIAYCEDNLRESLGVIQNEDSGDHADAADNAAQDPRPYHWRNYT